MVADMEVDKVADMQVDMMADIEVNMVPDMEIDMVADTVAIKVFQAIFFRPIFLEPNLTLACASSISLVGLFTQYYSGTQSDQARRQSGNKV